MMLIHHHTLFLLMLVLNEIKLFSLEFVRGVNWIYLPAGVIRLLCTLLFAEAGAAGLLIVSWLVCFLYFFPDDWIRSFSGACVAALTLWDVLCGAPLFWAGCLAGPAHPAAAAVAERYLCAGQCLASGLVRVVARRWATGPP